jgi:hypothetical protein
MEIIKFELQEGINAKSHRKESYFTDEYAVINISPSIEWYNRQVMIVRFYYTQTTAYCCIWIHSTKDTPSASGSGKAGGYGYHKGSAAFEYALREAGIKFDTHIAGTGDYYYNDILTKIATKLGYTNIYIHHAHS